MCEYCDTKCSIQDFVTFDSFVVLRMYPTTSNMPYYRWVKFYFLLILFVDYVAQGVMHLDILLWRLLEIIGNRPIKTLPVLGS